MVMLADIKTGDLLAWKKDRSSTLSNLFMKFIRLVTRSEFAHVGIAVKMEGTLYVFEAARPMVALAPVRLTEEIFHLPMGLEPTPESMTEAFKKIGLRYGYLDCVHAIIGEVSQSDNRWQCAELTQDFYQHQGVDINVRCTPIKVVNALKRYIGKDLTLVV